MDSGQVNKNTIGLARGALEASKEHRRALESYTQRLEAELEGSDELLDIVDTVDESDLDVGCFVTIPDSVRAVAPIATKELLSPESPFHQDALKRKRYQDVSEARAMKPKELEALAEAVQAESYRMHILESQKRSTPALLSPDALRTHIPALNDKGIAWDRVAEKVSNVSVTTRTPRECEIRWLGDQHPAFNHEPWTQEEVLGVKSLAAEFADSQPDWVIIAERLGTKRTPLDCMRHAIPRKSHQWTTETDKRLLKAIRVYGHENWHLVARYVSENATPSQCSSRFRKTLDESIKRTVWTREEDVRLSAAVAAYGSSWVDVADHVPGRHNDQCRERWTEQLNPSINKGPWSEEEDKALTDHVREHKNASWKQVAEHVRNGRTEAMCRKRYAVLQRGEGRFDLQTEWSDAVSSASRNMLSFKSSPSLHTTSTPYHTEYDPSKQLVFLEPVVSSNPASHKYRKRRSGDILPSNTSTVKKRRK